MTYKLKEQPNFTIVVLMFGFTVGALAGGFAGTNRAGESA